MKSVLRYGAFPILMVTAVMLFLLAIEKTSDFMLPVSLILMAFYSFLLILLERIIPFSTHWQKSDQQEVNDLGHAFIGMFLGARLGRYLVLLVFPGIATALAAWHGSSFWPTTWPLPVQIVLVYLIAEFGNYWIHRFMHTVPFLWRFHALHHSTERLMVLKAFRSHILERTVQSILSLGPLILLGAPAEVMMWYMVPNIFLGMFLHSNADLRFGILEFIFNGPGAHRYHHSIDLKEGNSNYGGAILVWDIIFGTYTCPWGKSGPAVLGAVNDRVPKGLIPQLLAPFCWNK